MRLPTAHEHGPSTVLIVVTSSRTHVHAHIDGFLEFVCEKRGLM